MAVHAHDLVFVDMHGDGAADVPLVIRTARVIRPVRAFRKGETASTCVNAQPGEWKQPRNSSSIDTIQTQNFGFSGGESDPDPLDILEFTRIHKDLIGLRVAVCSGQGDIKLRGR